MEEGTRRDVVPLDQVPKGRWERSWPTIACGAGLFSDGYLNGVSTHLHTLFRRGPCANYASTKPRRSNRKLTPNHRSSAR